jgi:CheY-like chemotaxis protein
MTGEKLGQELLKIRPDLPIIIATGYSKRINEESALEMGFKGLIMKPLDRRNLAKAIREALD